jgi:hypothetical protein
MNCPKCNNDGATPVYDEVDIGVGMLKHLLGWECSFCGNVAACNECGHPEGTHAAWCNSYTRPKVIYIASPYSGPEQAKNVGVQVSAAHRLMDLGHAPIAPLLTHFLEVYRQRPYQEWLNADLAILSKADIVLRLPGPSKGADAEVSLAQKLKIPVAFGWDDLTDLLK